MIDADYLENLGIDRETIVSSIIIELYNTHKTLKLSPALHSLYKEVESVIDSVEELDIMFEEFIKDVQKEVQKGDN